MFKPEGYNSVSPYLIVNDAQAALAFIKAVFGVEPEVTHRGEDGSIAHAEIRIDDTILMLGQFKDSGSAAHVHVYVPDVGHSFELAKKAGGKSVQEPVKKDDPDLRGGIVDPSGTTWWLSTRQE